MLCPRMQNLERLKLPWKKDRDPGAGFLRSAKPTEGQGWVHTLCSVFHPDVQYADAAVLRTVEGVSTVRSPTSRLVYADSHLDARCR